MAIRIRPRAREFDEPPREKRIRGGETQYAIPIEHLTDTVQKLVFQIQRARPLQKASLGFLGRQTRLENRLAKLIYTGAPVIKAEHAERHAGAQQPKWKSFLVPVRGGGIKLSTQLVKPSEVIGPLDGLPRFTLRAQLKPKPRLTLKAESTPREKELNFISGGTDPFLFKTCNRIAFKPKGSLFGTDADAEEALERLKKSKPITQTESRKM